VKFVEAGNTPLAKQFTGLNISIKIASGDYIKIKVVPCGSTLFLEKTGLEMCRFFYAKN